MKVKLMGVKAMVGERQRYGWWASVTWRVGINAMFEGRQYHGCWASNHG